MTDIYLQKLNGSLHPVHDSDRALVDKYPMGEFLRAEIVRPRNYRFHKKFFALLNVGFDAFEPEQTEYKGLPVQKSFDRFRRDCVIAAGYYTVVSNIKGEVRAEATSISFASMDEDQFQHLYSAVANVLLQKVLAHYTRDDLDRVVDQILMF